MFSNTIFHLQKEAFSVSYTITVKDLSVPSGFCPAKWGRQSKVFTRKSYYNQQHRSLLSNFKVLLSLFGSICIHLQGIFQ